MRENRTYGSEGGEAQSFPTPISLLFQAIRIARTQVAGGIR
jgi:hypothetical protein